MSIHFNNIVVTTLTAGALLMIGVHGPVQAGPVNKQSDEAVRMAVQAGNVRLAAAFRGADAAGVTDLFADEGMIVMSIGCFRGKAEVENRMHALFDQMGRATTAEIETASIHVDGDLAYEAGRWSLTYPTQVDRPAKVDGRYLVVWQRQQNGSWKIFRDVRLPMLP